MKGAVTIIALIITVCMIIFTGLHNGIDSFYNRIIDEVKICDKSLTPDEAVNFRII